MSIAAGLSASPDEVHPRPTALCATEISDLVEGTARRATLRSPSPWPDDALRSALDDGSITLQCKQGGRLRLDQRRWHADPTPADMAVLRRCRGAVLDVGCGPGRLVDALVRAGTVALGIDTSRAAVATTRLRGAPATHASVFGRVPWAGRWDTALLLDGNIGIGGDPRALLRRTRELIAPDGLILAEVEWPGAPSENLEVRVAGAGGRGPWFRWSRVSAHHVGDLAQSADLILDELWQDSGRWFAQLAPAVMEEVVAS